MSRVFIPGSCRETTTNPLPVCTLSLTYLKQFKKLLIVCEPGSRRPPVTIEGPRARADMVLFSKVNVAVNGKIGNKETGW
jgi:hypothetical protein